MTDKLFIDTDCLSAFLWVGNENILVKLYGGKIIVPKQVYDELSKPFVPHLKQKTDILIGSGFVSIGQIMAGTEEHTLYITLTSNPERGFRVIGRGEAAAIVLAKQNNGILASNNLRDVVPYVKKYGLQHITTADILVEALHGGLITENQGNVIWANMLQKQRKLPGASLTDYIKGINDIT
ncbi:hypothetical protein [Desulforamulus ferrireducens]|uniref:Nucleic acid-binding protein n=1 Tax=Desulforamulus ferrireducens TaxID=1833852 RepID=A0A1S6IUF5_9FIRM|nr:hypothetical protein [Desulforamulus ferrireducens]AQS58418.1 hypothetical protein B0537_04520 [Desulforamulus ferrireducens]